MRDGKRFKKDPLTDREQVDIFSCRSDMISFRNIKRGSECVILYNLHFPNTDISSTCKEGIAIVER